MQEEKKTLNPLLSVFWTPEYRNDTIVITFDINALVDKIM